MPPILQSRWLFAFFYSIFSFANIEVTPHLEDRLIQWLRPYYTSSFQSEERNHLLTGFLVSMYTYYLYEWSAAYNGTANAARKHEKLRSLFSWEACIAADPAHASNLSLIQRAAMHATFFVTPYEELHDTLDASSLRKQFYEEVYAQTFDAAKEAMESAAFWDKGDIGYLASEVKSVLYFENKLEAFLDASLGIYWDKFPFERSIFATFETFNTWREDFLARTPDLQTHPELKVFIEPWLNAVGSVLKSNAAYTG